MRICNLLLHISCLLSLSIPLHADEEVNELVRPNIQKIRKKLEKERLAREKAEAERKAQEEAKRKAEEERKRQEELAKADPMVDPAKVPLHEEPYQAETTFTVEPGSTLGVASLERYGTPHYATLIAVYNDVEVTKLKVGQTLKTPSITDMVRGTGKGEFVARFPDEAQALVKLYYDYQKLEPQLRKIADSSKLPEELRKTLQNYANIAQKTHKGLTVKRPGVQKLSVSTLGQLKGVIDQFQAMAKGDFGKKNSRIARVHLRLGYTLAYAADWGRRGFQ